MPAPLASPVKITHDCDRFRMMMNLSGSFTLPRYEGQSVGEYPFRVLLEDGECRVKEGWLGL